MTAILEEIADAILPYSTKVVLCVIAETDPDGAISTLSAELQKEKLIDVSCVALHSAILRSSIKWQADAKPPQAPLERLGQEEQALLSNLLYNSELDTESIAQEIYDCAETNRKEGLHVSATTLFAILEFHLREVGIGKKIRLNALVSWASALRASGCTEAAMKFYTLLDADLLKSVSLTDADLGEIRSRMYFNWGNAFDAIGNTADALSKHKLALEARTATGLGDDFEGAKLLVDVGKKLNRHGRLEEATDSYTLAIEVLSELAISYQLSRAQIGLAIVHGRLGKREESMRLFDEALKTLDLQSDIVGDQLIFEKAQYLMDKGVYVDIIGMAAASVSAFEQARTLLARLPRSFASRFDKGNTSTLLLARISMNQGCTLLQIGEFEDADMCFRDSDSAYAETDLCETEEHARVHINWGLSRHNQEKYESAVEHYDHALKIYKKPEYVDKLEAIGHRAILGMNRANALGRLGNSAAAIEQYRSVFEIYKRREFAVLPDYDLERIRVLGNWAGELERTGDIAAAENQYREAAAIFDNPLRNFRRELDFERSWITYRLTKLVAGGDLEVVRKSSLAVAKLIELWRGDDDNRVLDQVRGYYASINLYWAAESLEQKSFGQLPRFLSAIQGRRLSRQILDELDTSGTRRDLPSPVAQLIECREEQRRIAAELEKKYREEGRLEAESGSEKYVIDPDSIERLHQKYDQLLTEYSRLRDRVSSIEGYQHLVAPYSSIDSDALAAELREDEVLLCLIDMDVDDTEPLQGVWLLNRHGKSAWAKLAVDLDLAINLAKVEAQLGRGLRSNGLPKIDRPGLDWEGIRSHIVKTFWNPIQELLESFGQCSRVVVVTHGRYHRLPLELGKPIDLTLSHYPGLIFYLHRTKAVEKVTTRVGIPYQGRDLLFAKFEHCLVGVEDVEESLPDGKAQVVDRLFIGAHGRVDDGRPDFTHLYLGKPTATLSFYDFLRMRYRPRTVWLSACVVAQTREDADGDPLGILPALFMRGAETVVASLARVPDLWMPLLTGLTHYLESTKEISIVEALRESQGLLDRWIDETSLEPFKDRYVSWLSSSMESLFETKWRESCRKSLSEDIEAEFELKWRALFAKDSIADLITKLDSGAPISPMDQLGLCGLAADQREIEMACSRSGGNSGRERLQSLLRHLIFDNRQALVPSAEIVETLTYSVRPFGRAD